MHVSCIWLLGILAAIWNAATISGAWHCDSVGGNTGTLDHRHRWWPRTMSSSILLGFPTPNFWTPLELTPMLCRFKDEKQTFNQKLVQTTQPGSSPCFPTAQVPPTPRGQLNTMHAAGEYTGFVPDMQSLDLWNFKKPRVFFFCWRKESTCF